MKNKLLFWGMTTKGLPVLNLEEQRVLGALMEKSRTTPEYYPLTLNALVTACNQKTSRNPVVSYDENTVMLAIDSLRKKGLVGTVTGGTGRVTKYKHNFAIAYPIVPSEVTILCLLLLRGPLTPGEINNMSGRMFEFESLDEVQQNLDNLAKAEHPYLVQLAKRPGKKEARYAHLLGGPIAIEDYAESALPSSNPENRVNLEERLEKVENDLAQLRVEFDQLMQQLT